MVRLSSVLIGVGIALVIVPIPILPPFVGTILGGIAFAAGLVLRLLRM